ncbi:hypothetical protein FHT29_005210 [Rhizobium sp. SG741]|nr:hypothetical protein [Rhizobium sp. SG741]
MLNHGDRQVVAFYWPGDLFGLAEKDFYVNSIEAITACTVYIAAPYLHRRALVPVLKAFSVDRSNIPAYWPESRRQSERQGAGIVPRRGLSLAHTMGQEFCGRLAVMGIHAF